MAHGSKVVAVAQALNKTAANGDHIAFTQEDC
eukprot:CAMPEP_0179471174 /NCGR_PEP_ID=MMETSP0799-20121207/51469_1 /TAXON_ID=46947 /ORGANISM="Geminigera cryophila, Strain CCMP2564" /LENGTH=31 /DNA_ID= /DNA_START= /DNA_END= /DNA_ORIENTATION=